MASLWRGAAAYESTKPRLWHTKCHNSWGMAMLDRARASATILLAEDDESLARMIDDVLTCRGYRVLHAPCAAEAESVAAQDRPDLIIVDLMLPDANGLVLCADLKA